MTFDDYYRGRFRQDLAAVLQSAPRSHEHPGDPDGGTIQPRSLSIENRAIGALSPGAVGHFATALYFTVLVDEVMYTHFQPHYDAFEALTRYPKLRGDCPGGCSSHIHPSHIFGALNQPAGSWKANAYEAFRDNMREAVPVMRREVLNFFPMHLQAVDGAEVWRRCRAESPLNDVPG
jgi:hypothetical protein